MVMVADILKTGVSLKGSQFLAEKTPLFDIDLVEVNDHPHSGWLGCSAIDGKTKARTCFHRCACHHVQSTRLETNNQLISGFRIFRSDMWNMEKGVTGLREFSSLEVKVVNNDLEKAMKILKRKLQKDGVFRRLKAKRSYEKPSECRRRKRRESERRQRTKQFKSARSRNY
jgi:small subunit ribosomal protein S21